MFGDCSANIPRLVADHRRIFAEHFSRQNIANGSWKISRQALKILGIGEMLPHEYHEFTLFAEGSVIPPEHRLMLVSFHRECIGDAKKAQWDRGIRYEDDYGLIHILSYWLGGWDCTRIHNKDNINMKYVLVEYSPREPKVNTYTARPVCWNGWISDSSCSLKPLCSGMGEVVPARTSPTLLPPSPRTVLSLSCFKVLQCINCRD